MSRAYGLSSWSLCRVAAVAVGAAFAAEAQVPVGGQFQVNTSTTGGQTAPSVAMAGDGDFIAVWVSSVARAGSSLDSQRFESSGAPSGTEFQVNTSAVSNQASPAIAAAEDGSFVAVWQNGDIHAQRYDVNGLPAGAELVVNTYTTGVQTSPSVAGAPDGRFVVAWQSAGSPGTDTGSSESVQARRYAADGTPQDVQFQVNTYTTGVQSAPAVAVAPDGDFIIAWQSQGSAGTDTDGASIQAQRYASNGAPQGAEFQVNSYTTGNQTFPSVAAASDGDYLLVWTSTGSPGTDSDNTSIQGQLYGADGMPQGTQFQVNTITASVQNEPSVARDALGGFVAVWTDAVGTRADSRVRGQRYAFDGSPNGAEFQVNAYTTGSQGSAAVAGGPSGTFVITWQSEESPGTDSDSNSIQGQRFTIATAIPSLSSEQALAASLLLLALGWLLARHGPR